MKIVSVLKTLQVECSHTECRQAQTCYFEEYERCVLDSHVCQRQQFKILLLGYFKYPLILLKCEWKNRSGQKTVSMQI